MSDPATEASADLAAAAEDEAAASRQAPAPSLPRDWTSTWLVALVAAAMGFLASLAVAIAAGAEGLAASWTEDLAARATVVLAPAADDLSLGDALSAIRRVEGVAAARPLDEAAMIAHIGPWLGDAQAIDGLALPRLIDVTLRRGHGGPAAIQAIAEALAAADIPAEVDGHGEWIARLAPAAAAVRSLAYGALAMIALAAGLTVALACVAGLAAQAHIVEVLKLIGAEDAYIARIFVRRSQILAFAGSAVGAAAAALMLATSGAGPAEADAAALAPVLPSLQPQGADWVRLTAIPLVFALIATASAYAAVAISLSRREH